MLNCLAGRNIFMYPDIRISGHITTAACRGGLWGSRTQFPAPSCHYFLLSPLTWQREHAINKELQKEINELKIRFTAGRLFMVNLINEWAGCFAGEERAVIRFKSIPLSLQHFKYACSM
jgi:hypothetical protein